MPFVVYASPVVQAIETAEIICDQLKKSDGVSLIQPDGVVVSDELRNYAEFNQSFSA